MTTSTKDRQADEPALSAAEPRPRQVIGRFLAPTPEGVSTPLSEGKGNGYEEPTRRPPIAVFCHESPDSYIGGHVAQVARQLALRGRVVHLIVRHPFLIEHPRVHVHAVGPAREGDIIEGVKEYTRQAGNAFLKCFGGDEAVEVIAYEWSSASVLPLLRGLRNVHGVLSLHSLERQRSDVTSEVALAISEIEREAMEAARTLLVHDQATAEVARLWMPACSDRLVQAISLFPAEEFEAEIDPGTIKARYQVGPTDPMLLFIGDMDDPYGPDVLLKTMPAILRHHPQTRLVLVGDGQLFWPLKVYARYLLLEHAVRFVGDVQGQALRELVQAADIVVVPSRRSTPWWPILAGWAARRPVVATHEAAKPLTEHEKDSVLVYPSENSVVWGVERVLYDAELRKTMGEAGRRKLDVRFGWTALAEQVEDVLATAVTVGR